MKQCSKCKQTKSTSFFNKSKGKFVRFCRECEKQYRKELSTPQSIKSHRTRTRTRNKSIRQNNRQKLLEYLQTQSCKDCGNDNILVLQFDHLRDKKETINRMVSNTSSWDAIQKEIEKCEVVCANCHTIRTATRDGRWFKSLN